jgi:hypothetical protein
MCVIMILFYMQQTLFHWWQAEQLQARKREQDEFKSALESSKSKVNSLRKDLQERKDEIAKMSLAQAELKQVGFL